MSHLPDFEATFWSKVLISAITRRLLTHAQIISFLTSHFNQLDESVFEIAENTVKLTTTRTPSNFVISTAQSRTEMFHIDEFTMNNRGFEALNLVSPEEPVKSFDRLDVACVIDSYDNFSITVTNNFGFMSHLQNDCYLLFRELERLHEQFDRVVFQANAYADLNSIEQGINDADEASSDEEASDEEEEDAANAE
jgi:hypothetical protein